MWAKINDWLQRVMGGLVTEINVILNDELLLNMVADN